MTSTSIRKRLFDYIRFADEKKIKAIYTMVEEEIKEKQNVWTKEFEAEMNKRSKDMESGRVKGKSWEDVNKKAGAILRKRRG